MQRKNIPSYVLAKGISKEGFEQLLEDIRNAAIEEGVKEFSNYSEMIESIKAKDNSEGTNQWISDFEAQLNESTKIINDNMAKIEDLFNRIFNDWEIYKKEHGIMDEIKDESSLEVTPSENVEVVEEAKEEVKLEVPTENEDVKVELEPVKVEDSTVVLEAPVVEETPVVETEEKEAVTVEVPVVEEAPVEEKTKKEKKSKKDKSEVTEGDNNG